MGRTFAVPTPYLGRFKFGVRLRRNPNLKWRREEDGTAEGLMGRESIRKRNTGWHLCATRLLLLATRHATSLLKADVPAYDNTSCGYATYIKTSEEDSHVIHAQHSPFSILAAKHFTKHIHLSKTVATWRAAPRKKKTAPAAFKNSHDEYASTPPRRSPGI